MALLPAIKGQALGPMARSGQRFEATIADQAAIKLLLAPAILSMLFPALRRESTAGQSSRCEARKS